MLLAAKFEEGAVCRYPILLGGDIAVSHGALPKRCVEEERPEGGVVFVGGELELFCSILVCLFADFPDLQEHQRELARQGGQTPKA